MKTLLAVASGAVFAIATFAAKAGVIVLIGGVLRYDNETVWKRIVELAGGPRKTIIVFPTATGRPGLYGSFAVSALRGHGAYAEMVPVSPDTVGMGMDYRQAVQDEKLLARVRRAHGVFFTGGAPQHLAQTLYEPDGADSPMLAAIRELHDRGGVIVGANAGHAVVSTGIGPDTALRSGLPEQAIQRGLGMLPERWFFDQHYFTHGRFAVSLAAMRKLGLEYGIGIGVGTALTVTDGRRAKVLGTGGVMIVDLSEARLNESGQPFRLERGRLSHLDGGDRFDLKTLQIVPSESRRLGFTIDPHADNRQPLLEGTAFRSDIYAQSALPALVLGAIDSERRQSVGLARRTGFQFRFYTGAESFGWFNDLDDFTASNVYLDVTPLAKPKPRQR